MNDFVSIHAIAMVTMKLYTLSYWSAKKFSLSLSLDVFLYFYPPGVPVDDNGGGRTIRISAQ